MQERRRLSRWLLSQSAKIRLKGAVKSADCTVKDINFNGMQIALKLRLPQNKYFNFRLDLDENTCLELEAWVAWHKIIDGRNVYGLYFTKIDSLAKERIYKYVYKNSPQKAKTDEGGEKMEDRRIFQRFNIRFPVKLLGLENGKEYLAETSDVSAKGLGLYCKDYIEPKTTLEAWLQIPDKGEPVYTRGNVVWQTQAGKGEYRLGLDLEKADLMGLSRILRS